MDFIFPGQRPGLPGITELDSTMMILAIEGLSRKKGEHTVGKKPTKEDLVGRVQRLEEENAGLKEVENKLQESEERYRSFVQNFAGIAFWGRLNLTPIFFHGAVEKITGYNEQDATNRFAGKTLAGFIQKPYRSAKLLVKVREALE